MTEQEKEIARIINRLYYGARRGFNMEIARYRLQHYDEMRVAIADVFARTSPGFDRTEFKRACTEE